LSVGIRAAFRVPLEILLALVASTVADGAGELPLIKLALMVPLPVGARLAPVPTSIVAVVLVPLLKALKSGELLPVAAIDQVGNAPETEIPVPAEIVGVVVPPVPPFEIESGSVTTVVAFVTLVPAIRPVPVAGFCRLAAWAALAAPLAS